VSTPKRPRRSAVEEARRHEQCVIAALTLTEALAGLYPDVPELRTAQTCLEIARKEFGKRTEATVVSKAPEGEQP
jgi:hypothetical protein